MKNSKLLTILIAIFTIISLNTYSKTNYNSKLKVESLQNSPIKLIPFPENIKWETDNLKFETINIKNFNKLSKRIKNELYNLFEKNGIEIRPDATFSLSTNFNTQLENEEYKLNIKANTISIISKNENGLYFALKTLKQLSSFKNNNCFIQSCSISDKPVHKIRGYMLDCGRNYFSLEILKHQIDVMADYKLNTFHWHLTDRPAWRIESKIYPELNNPKHYLNARNPGMFYSFDEIRELIKYARDRNVTVIPELDMPGHSDAFVRAMGCTMDSEKGMKILENLLNEFFKEIPIKDCPYIHIGSDEVHIKNPKEFIAKMVSIVENNNRKAIVWAPGLKAPKSVIRQTWGTFKTKEHDYKLIDSRRNYINNGDPLLHTRTIFFNNIGYQAQNEVIGGIICLWPDINLRSESDALILNPFYSSLLTFSWKAWSGNMFEFNERNLFISPPKGTNEFEFFNIFEDYLISHKKKYFNDELFFYRKQSNKNWQIIGTVDSLNAEHIKSNLNQQQYSIKGKKLIWQNVVGNSICIKNRFSKETVFPEIQKDDIAFVKTWIYSPNDRDVDVWISFESPARANRIYTGIPLNGQLGTSDEKVWINRTELKGRVWNNPGWKTEKQEGWASRKNLEKPWDYEEIFWLRKPYKIHLNQGWNQVSSMLKLKHKYQNYNFVFCILQDEDLIFSPERKK
jgi:hypothetical protein